MTGRIGAKGQVVIPKVIRDQAQLRPGDEVDFALQDDQPVRWPGGGLARSAVDFAAVGWPHACWRIAAASRDERLSGFLGDLGMARR